MYMYAYLMIDLSACAHMQACMLKNKLNSTTDVPRGGGDGGRPRALGMAYSASLAGLEWPRPQAISDP